VLVGAGVWLAAAQGGGGISARLAALAQDWDIPGLVLRQRLGTGGSSLSGLSASPVLSSLVLEDQGEEELAAEGVALLQAAEITQETGEPAAQETSPTDTPPAEEETAPSTVPAVPLSQLSLNNGTEMEVDLEAVAALNTTVSLSTQGPQILIMHTHGTEAYTPDGDDQYTASDSYRTTDEDYNMLRVGEEITAVLEEAGYSVLHDTTLYDYPSYTGSYARARAGIQALMEEYPSISLVIDVHRDALIASDGTAYKVLTTLEGEKTAQLMLVVGTDAGGLEHPNWRGNLSFALQVQERLLALDTTLPREINLRTSRFNQDLTPASLLVEVGSCGNTLEEALAGGRRFAQALAQALETGEE
jgi:stage II sporulation protein P